MRGEDYAQEKWSLGDLSLAARLLVALCLGLTSLAGGQEQVELSHGGAIVNPWGG